MAIDATFIARALLKYNYLPFQKRDKSEVPPCFSSRKFTPKIAKLVDASTQRKGGWDAISYRATRFNGVPRILSIPHPVPHASLSLHIAYSWNELAYITKAGISEIRPRRHRDGRIVIMDYGRSASNFKKQYPLSFSRRFRVHTDIANCFPSIYSHSIPWATVGFTAAKAQKTNKNAWFNQLDELIRFCKRNETNGIAIGPATSNVVVESILAKVDHEMSVTHGFIFIRYIDDYTAYCDSEEDAQRFIRLLGTELDRYKLLLNIKKNKDRPVTRADRFLLGFTP